MREMMQWSSVRGIRVIIMTGEWDSWDTGMTGSPSWSQFKADVIMNKDGIGDQWINGWGQVIRDLQPYAADVMNEPMGVSGTTYEPTTTYGQFVEAYRQFCVRAIDAWRLIKPDLVCVINGCPFWDLKPLAANPIPRANLIYAVHYYYANDGTLGQEPSNIDLAYWEGRLAEAKTLLESFLLNDEGVEACGNAGLDLLMEETGTCLEASNAFAFMQDMYDFCKSNNLGAIHHALVPYPKSKAGLLSEDWTTLNSLGELWSQNMHPP
jgi:hypothetical protein